jgi:hypothetical protein
MPRHVTVYSVWMAWNDLQYDLAVMQLYQPFPQLGYMGIDTGPWPVSAGFTAG